MLRSIVFLSLLITTNACADEGVRLNLINSEGKLMLYIANKTDNMVIINKRFADCRPIDPSEIVMTFQNEKGEKFQPTWLGKIGPAAEDDYISLGPNDFVGKHFERSRIILDYGLKPGKYEVSAIFNDTSLTVKGAFDKRLESNVTSIVVR